MDKVTNFPHFHAIQLVLGKPESNLTLLNAMKTTLHTSICIYDYCLCEWVVKDKWFWSFKEWRICFLYTCEPYIFGICHTLLWLWYTILPMCVTCRITWILFFLCDSSGFYNHSLKQGKRKESLFGCELCGMSKIPTHSFETKSYILKRINKNTFLILLNCFDSTFAYGGLSSPYS
jgi:hypothetical protein